MRILYTLFILFLHLSSLSAQSVVFNNQLPKHEVRAVWLTTIGGVDWPHSYAQSERSAEKQKQELRDILDKLRAARINTVLIQTRVRGTMIYPSQYEPWDGCLSGFPGKAPGYDALKFAIEECHKRGMEVHAWVVTIPVGKWNALGCKQLRNQYKGLIRKIGADGYMNPEDSRTGTYLANICKEITRNYDIDGIHLDYIRYPETWNIRVSRDQGRIYITNIVRKIHDAVKGEKPWVKMSCSPIGKHDDLSRYWSHGWNAYTKVCQEAQAWLRDGLMDELFPMMYFRNEQFFPFAIDWQEQSFGKIIAPGLGIYFLDPKEGNWNIKDITTEMHHLRNIGAGCAFFRTKFFLDNQQGIYDFTRKLYAAPALVPPMTWESAKKPMKPTDLSVKNTDGVVYVSWKNCSLYEDNSPVKTPHIYNNVYASYTYPVDTEDARNLIASRLANHTFALTQQEDERNLYFAVTSMDGYGNESEPLQSFMPGTPQQGGKLGAAKRLQCSGGILHIPAFNEFDLYIITIKSMQGQTLRRYRYGKNTVSVSDLPPGNYQLWGENKRGATTPMGSFSIRGN